jgi:signal transduction histidine kinase
VCGLSACLAVFAASALLAWALTGWGFAEAVDAFVVSNLVIGASFGACGALIAWHRPSHPVGWLFLVGGVAQTASAACAPLAQLALDHAEPVWVARLLVTGFGLFWPIHIGVCLPLSLALLPDGHLPSRRWVWVFVAVAVTSPLFVLQMANGHSDGTFPDGFLLLPTEGGWAALWAVGELRWIASMLVGLTAVAVRYRRGDETVRRQLLWVVLAGVTLFVAVLPWALVAGTPIVVLFAVPLLPAGIAVAVLRHQLFDIPLVLARGVAHLLLSGLVLAGYAVLILVLSGVASALIVAMLALPVRVWLQNAVERAFYGDRRHPDRVATRVVVALHDLDESLRAVRASLHLPYTALRDVTGHCLGTSGSPTGSIVHVDLGGELTLDVGLRAGEKHLAPRDSRVLDMISGPLQVAVNASIAARDLQASRERLVTAREEERRRLRRDLHDGLGTLLTGIVLTADAASNTSAADPEESTRLLATVRSELRHAVTEIHRLVDDLAPLAVQELGLAAALSARADQTTARADGHPLRVEVHTDLPQPLPEALEVAAYRIATEALTNVIRHACASRATIRVQEREGMLEVEVTDDGHGHHWGNGVGTLSMRERAEELGGTCQRGPGPDGGLVRALIPIGTS